MRCGLITAGVVWDPASQSFRVEESSPGPHTALGQLGVNTRNARQQAELSQQALVDRASMSRGDLVDFERGTGTSGSSPSYGWLARCVSPSLSCLPAWRTGISARWRRRNFCRRSPDQSRARPASYSALGGRTPGTRDSRSLGSEQELDRSICPRPSRRWGGPSLSSRASQPG